MALVLVVALVCVAGAAGSAHAALAMKSFSVFSTLPSAAGDRIVSVSFRVAGADGSAVGASTVGVGFDGDTATFKTPALAAGAEAYVSRSFRTKSNQVVILAEVGSTRRHATARFENDPARWVSIGPSKIQAPSGTVGVGRVTTIAIDPRSTTTFYAGARGAGIWKTVDGGVSWFPTGDALPTAQIEAIAIDPNDPNRVLVASPAGIFESRDAGAVWVRLTDRNLEPLGVDGGALLVGRARIPTRLLQPLARFTEARVESIFKEPPPLYLSTRKGLQVSTDGGRNWTVVLGAGFPVTSLQFSTTDPSHLFASVAAPATPPGIYEAKDGGLTAASWHRLQGCPSGPLPQVPASSNIWIAESRGRQWMSYRSGSADGQKREIWRTTGETCEIDGWIENAWAPLPLAGTCADYANHWSYLFAHPTDPLILFKGGIALCRSNNAGSSMVPVPKIHADHHAIAVSRANPSLMLFGSDGGIYRSTDKGLNLAFIGEGMSVTEFLDVDVDGTPPRIVVGGTQDNGMSAFDGKSPVWKYIAGGDSSLVAFEPADRSVSYEMGQSTRQLARHHSTHVGLGDASLPDCISYSERPSLSASMVPTGGTPPLMVTCEGIWRGPPWKRIQAETAGAFKRLRLGPDGMAAAATDQGHVFYGTFREPTLAPVSEAPDAGLLLKVSTLQLRQLSPLQSGLVPVFRTPVPAVPAAIAFVDARTFYVAMNAGEAGNVYRLHCTDTCVGERAWPGAGTPSGQILALAADPIAANAVFASVRGRGVFRGLRDAAGKWTWNPHNDGLPFGVTVTDLEPAANATIVASAWGRGAFRLRRQPPVKAELKASPFPAERIR